MLVVGEDVSAGDGVVGRDTDGGAVGGLVWVVGDVVAPVLPLPLHAAQVRTRVTATATATNSLRAARRSSCVGTAHVIELRLILRHLSLGRRSATDETLDRQRCCVTRCRPGLAAAEDEAGMPAGVVDEGRVEVDIAGVRYPVRASLRPMFDPDRLRIKA